MTSFYYLQIILLIYGCLYPFFLSPANLCTFLKNIVTRLEVSFRLNWSLLCICNPFLTTALNFQAAVTRTKVVTLADGSALQGFSTWLRYQRTSLLPSVYSAWRSLFTAAHVRTCRNMPYSAKLDS